MLARQHNSNNGCYACMASVQKMKAAVSGSAALPCLKLKQVNNLLQHSSAQSMYISSTVLLCVSFDKRA
jgi:hypothetical protein